MNYYRNDKIRAKETTYVKNRTYNQNELAANREIIIRTCSGFVSTLNWTSRLSETLMRKARCKPIILKSVHMIKKLNNAHRGRLQQKGSAPPYSESAEMAELPIGEMPTQN